MGPGALSALHILLILFTTFLAVFLESAWAGTRFWLGAQVDVLPAFVVYAALAGDLMLVTLIAFFGGLWFDSLSANPLGLSILPLLVTGVGLFSTRELLLRDQLSAQLILGAAAGAAVPLLGVLILLTLGERPLLGWGSLWQWVVLTAGGAALTPLTFRLFDRLDRWFSYQPLPETTFRHERQMKRGRH